MKNQMNKKPENDQGQNSHTFIIQILVLSLFIIFLLSEDALKRTNKIFQIPEKENVKANAGNKNLKGRNLQGTTNKITKYINSPGGQAKIIGGNINDGDIQEVKINDTTAESFAYLLVDLPQGINETEIFFTSNDINSLYSDQCKI